MFNNKTVFILFAIFGAIMSMLFFEAKKSIEAVEERFLFQGYKQRKNSKRVKGTPKNNKILVKKVENKKTKKENSLSASVVEQDPLIEEFPFDGLLLSKQGAIFNIYFNNEPFLLFLKNKGYYQKLRDKIQEMGLLKVFLEDVSFMKEISKEIMDKYVLSKNDKLSLSEKEKKQVKLDIELKLEEIFSQELKEDFYSLNNNEQYAFIDYLFILEDTEEIPVLIKSFTVENIIDMKLYSLDLYLEIIKILIADEEYSLLDNIMYQDKSFTKDILNFCKDENIKKNITFRELLIKNQKKCD